MTKGIPRHRGLWFLLIFLFFVIQSCSSNDDSVDTSSQGAPEIPDMATMKIDLSFFGLAPIDQVSMEKGKPSPELLASQTGKDNWINAAVRVFYVQLVFFAAFEPPITAFALAINSVPQEQPDGSWLWTYIYVENGMEYSIFLYGKKVADSIEWRLEVSTTNPDMPMDHFVWFDGSSALDNTSGYWQFYRPSDTLPLAASSRDYRELIYSVPSVRIDWLNTANDEHKLSVLNNDVGNPDLGDSLVFYSSPNINYLEFVDVSLGEMHNITWYPDGSGSIEVPDYNNGQKACWDTRQYDTPCIP